jgi:hypothetical protein
MEEFIRNSIDPKTYNRIQIREMFSLENKNYFVITTKGFGSQNCMNLLNAKKHNNNTIYFIVTARGVSQRCFCRCVGADKLALRREGLCKDYKSPHVVLTNELLRTLFPDKHKANPLLNNIENSRFDTNPLGYKNALKRILDSQEQKLFKNNTSSQVTSPVEIENFPIQVDIEEVHDKYEKEEIKEYCCYNCDSIVNIEEEVKHETKGFRNPPSDETCKSMMANIERLLKLNNYKCKNCC